jgi:hypothetical protein
MMQVYADVDMEKLQKLVAQAVAGGMPSVDFPGFGAECLKNEAGRADRLGDFVSDAGELERVVAEAFGEEWQRFWKIRDAINLALCSSPIANASMHEYTEESRRGTFYFSLYLDTTAEEVVDRVAEILEGKE